MKIFALLRSFSQCSTTAKYNGFLQSRNNQTGSAMSKSKGTSVKHKYPAVYDPYGPRPPPSEKIVQLAEQIASLSPEERSQIGPTLREKLNSPKIQIISTDGMGTGAAAEAGAGPAVAEEKKKEEKTTFEVKLEKFDAASKIKVIKEVRALTDLGLKEAKDLVEKAPTVLKAGVTKEEAATIIEKIKAAGGVAVMD